MRFLLLLLALLPVAAVAQIETPSTGGGGGGGGGTSTPYYGPFTNLTVYGTTTNALKLSSGVITSSLPAIDISQTWSNSGVTFTGLKLDVANSNSSSTSLLMDLLIGGSKKFTVDKGGNTYIPSGSAGYCYGNVGSSYYTYLSGQSVITTVNGSDVFGVNPTETVTRTRFALASGSLSADLFLARDAAASLQLGADAATATAQTIKAHDGSGSDKAGGSLTLAGGQNTGIGVGGALITKTSLPGSGSGLGSLGTRHYAYAGQKALTDSVIGNLFDVSIPTNKYASVKVFVSIKAADGFGGWSVNTIEKNFSAYNEAGTINVGQSSDTTSLAHALTGSEIVTIEGAGTGGNALRISATFTSDGWAETPTFINARWQIWINSDDVATVTPL